MQTVKRRLVVMRHGKAEQVAPSDLERNLAPGGRRDAAAAGRWLASDGFRPDHALVSTAHRTRQTWEAVCEGGGWALPADYRSDLYSAGPEATLDLLRMVPSDCTAVLLVGHNPTVSHLVQLLSDGLGAPEVLAAMTAGTPTSALAVLTFDAPWTELSFGDARVLDFHVARA